MDKIFYPDRGAHETARLQQEWAEFIALQRTADPILWPDLSADEAVDLLVEGEQFFQSAVRRKSAQ